MEEINLSEFIDLVQEMRFNQKRYFATRNPEVLKRSKELEKKVDEIIYSKKNPQLKFFYPNEKI